MKFFYLTLVFVLYQNQNVNGNFINFLAATFSDLAATFTSTVDAMRTNVINLFRKGGGDLKETHNASALTNMRSKTTMKPQLEFVPLSMPYNKIPKFNSDRILFDEDSKRDTSYPRMSTIELASTHGRKVESHIVTTTDGYVLTVHRLLPEANFTNLSYNKTVILHHGLLGSSADWLLAGPRNSLPYMLTQAGYDVWMANARGNYYSRGHVFKNCTSPDYWNFSWQQIGQFDLAATVDYIRKSKRYNESNVKIDFVGHSMGCSALLVLLSTLPNYNQYLRIGILMAPLAYMSNTEGPLRTLMTMSTNPPDQLIKLMGSTEFMKSRQMPKWIANKYCAGPMLFCANPLYFISGGIYTASRWEQKYIERIMFHIPAGGSTNTIMHYGQLVKSGKFHKYKKVNEEFPLNQVTVPIALFSSDDDWLATISDVLRLYFSIANPIDHYIIRGKNFSHTEFVWSPNVKFIVFSKVLEYLESDVNWLTMKSNEVTAETL